ncbi:MAG: PEP-CTERM sorting domain-containing protein, partial [Planctomycetota bacterium]
DAFVTAGDVAPGLAFDSALDASPAIEDFFFFDPADPEPALTLVQHQGDRLVFQGRSEVETIFGRQGISSFLSFNVFRLPLDIPDLPATVRDYYAAADLQGLASEDLPFTFRVTQVPEPAGVLLMVIAAAALVARRTCRA